MKQRFFLFSETRDTLRKRVDDAIADNGQDLKYKTFDEIVRAYRASERTLWRDGTSNPLTVGTDPEGRIFPRAHGAPDGYGVPLEGPADEVAALIQAIRTCDGTDDPLRQCTIGGEFGPGRPLFAAPQWRNWATGTGRGRAFATRRQARRLIGADALRDENLDGEGVRVVVIDRGLNQGYIQGTLGGDYADGFDWETPDGTMEAGKADAPYERMPREHGALVARTIHDLAPAVKFWDLPLIPRQIERVTPFALSAAFAMFAVWVVSSLFGTHRWVVVNAWGIDDRFGEDVWNDYATGRSHPLNVWTRILGETADVVFAAGNSGQFQPDPEAGPYDRGPGRSIWGANAGGNVTSVGAVRADGTWVGTSSQGPGPSSLGADPDRANEKPDLCAPSWFVENHDRALRSGGTSAACAVAAGVIAAFRQGWPQDVVSPSALRGILRATARSDWHTGWNGRLGSGIVNVPGALQELKAASVRT